jgi:hypothetical protein
MSRLDTQMARLATLPVAELGPEWMRVYKIPAPRLPADTLRLGIAYRLQEKALGRLPASVARAISRPSSSPTIKSGTQLVRSWNGRTISVLATDDGFVMDGQTYRSLSAIARLVTGAAWSGPRFFGITANG